MNTESDKLYAAIFPILQTHFDHSSVLSDIEDATWDVVNQIEDNYEYREL